MTNQPTIKDVKFSDLMEDLLGFGGRTYRSLKDSALSPRRYFTAAKDPDWRGIYSPSVRIYIGLVAVSAFFRFLYAGDEGAMTALYEQQFTVIFDQVESKSGERPAVSEKEMALMTLKYYFALAPFVALPFYMIVGLMFQSFGEKLNAVVRIRYIFAALLPATLLLTLTTLFYTFLSVRLTSIISTLSLFIAAVVISITLYFGAFPDTMRNGIAKIGRSIGLSLLIFIAMLLSAILTVFIATIIATYQAAAAGLI